MRQHNKDLFLILVIAIMNIIWVCFPMQSAIIGVFLALLLVFLVPGYLLIELLTQKQEHDAITRLLLSIGLSLSIDILGGFLLNIISIGLTTLTWGIFLSAFTIACLLLCMGKRRRWPISGDQKQKGLPTRYTFLLLTLTMYVAIVVFLRMTYSIEDQKYQRFTQFWLLLDNHQSHICTIQLGVKSSEMVTTTYQVEVKKNKQHATRWSSIRLAPQQKWQGQLPLTINHAQTARLQIEANLYRQQEPNSVYRTVQLLLTSSKIACT